MADLLSVILAAGKGTRMKSKSIKVLHKVAGKPMLSHVIDTVNNISSELICIVGYQGDKVKKEFSGRDINFVTQEKQLGTGHAVKQVRDYIISHNGPVLILCGDTPLLKEKTIKNMVKKHKANDAGLTILTALVEDPSGYGRIIKNNQGHIVAIREEEDATEEEKTIEEVNSGVYCFDSKLLAEALTTLTSDNAQDEYYLTDTISYIKETDAKIISAVVNDSAEITGINDRKNLAKAEKVIRKQINNLHMENGVTIIDPVTTYIDANVKIGQDTVVYPFTYIEGNTEIGPDCIIGPHNRLVAAKIGEGVNLQANCIIKESDIGNNCNIGPFAYIRPGCSIDEGVKIGDYVELKKAKVAKKTKIPHLSYVGDAEIGEKTNIGAGTIFANYDGENKHKTIVGNSVFIGSNSTLVAPVKVNDEGKTGAGAVVTKDVEENTTVVGVPARVYKKGGK